MISFIICHEYYQQSKCPDFLYINTASRDRLVVKTLRFSSATSLSIPSWAVTQIEQGIYRFFWSGKKPLVNRDILVLPLKEGGFNIARLDSKIQALRLNTLRRMLTGEEAHWKHFTAFFLSVRYEPWQVNSCT